MIDFTFSIYPQSVRGWTLAPLANICTEVRKRNSLLSEDNLLSLSYGKIIRKDIQSSEGLLPDSFDGYNIVEAGDTVLRLTDLQNDKRSLRTGLVQERGIITSAYTTIRPLGVDPRWLSYTLHSYDIQKIFYSLGSGLRQSMKFDDLKSLAIAVPLIEEQRRIADYLDEQIEIIDATCVLKQRQVEDNLAIHDSNKNHLIWGDENISLTPLRYVVKCNSNSLGADTDPNFRFAYCDVGSVNFRTGISPELETVSYAEAPTRARRLAKTGDVLFSMVRPYLRAVSIIPEFDDPHIFSTAFAVLEPVKVRAEYLFEVLTTSKFLFDTALWSSGMGYPAINQQDLLGLRIPVMNLPAQSERISLLADQRDAMLSFVNLVETSMGILQKYKASLITAAVTGQFDVTTGRSVA